MVTVFIIAVIVLRLVVLIRKMRLFLLGVEEFLGLEHDLRRHDVGLEAITRLPN